MFLIRFILLPMITIYLSINCHSQIKIGGIDISSANSRINSQFNDASCDTLFSFECNGPFLSGIAWDGENLWLNDGSSYLRKYSINGDLLGEISSPIPSNQWGRFGGMTYDDSTLWVVGEQAAKLYQISMNGYVINSFNLPSFGLSDPNGHGIAFDGINLWHSEYDSCMIYKISPINGTVIDSIIPPIPITSLDFIDGILYGVTTSIGNEIPRLVGIDTASGQFIDTVEWCIPLPIGLVWDGEYIWGTSGPEEFLGFPTGGTSRVYMTNTELSPTFNNISTESSDENIIVYPNPFTSHINIESSCEINGSIYITNLLGEIVYHGVFHKSTLNLDLDFLPSGMYIVRTAKSSKVIIKK